MVFKRYRGRLLLHIAITDLVLCVLLMTLSEKKLRKHQPSEYTNPVNLKILGETYF
jgi:hypothetical protein